MAFFSPTDVAPLRRGLLRTVRRTFGSESLTARGKKPYFQP